MGSAKHHGSVVRVSANSGLAIVQDKKSGHLYPFTFDKIEGYRGERARDIGLQEGKALTFYLDTETDTIGSVVIEAEAPAAG